MCAFKNTPLHCTFYTYKKKAHQTAEEKEIIQRTYHAYISIYIRKKQASIDTCLFSRKKHALFFCVLVIHLQTVGGHCARENTYMMTQWFCLYARTICVMCTHIVLGSPCKEEVQGRLQMI